MVIIPAGARGHYEIQCNARWHEIKVFSLTTASISIIFGKTENEAESISLHFSISYETLMIF